MHSACWYDKATASIWQDVPVDEWASLRKNPNGVLWVDILMPTDEDVALLSNVFKFHPLAIEDCIHPQIIPKLEMHKDYIFLVVHGVQVNMDSGKPVQILNAGRLETKELDVFIGKNYVVTVHDKALHSLNRTRDNIRENPAMLEEGAMVLAYSFLDLLVDLYLPVVDQLDDRLAELEQKIRTRPREDMTHEFLDLHHAIMKLQRLSRKQEEVFSDIVRKGHPLMTEEDLVRFQDIDDHLVRLIELSNSYRENLGWILDTHLALVSNKTNDTMRILTIYNVILLPLGFITSFYGMNFDQPETHWMFGYPFVIFLMMSILLGVIVYFRRKSWI